MPGIPFDVLGVNVYADDLDGNRGDKHNVFIINEDQTMISIDDNVYSDENGWKDSDENSSGMQKAGERKS